MLNKNEDNIDNSLRLMAPFYRVFANTLGTGPWFDTYIQNFPPVPQVPGVVSDDRQEARSSPASSSRCWRAAAVVMFRGEERKTLTAHFPRTVSIYEGSDVRVLGVPVGTVDTVTPSGTDVVVTMSYDAETKVPADAKAVIIAPSIVGDRFVQLTPGLQGRARCSPTARPSTEEQTAVPLELDQIYSSMDQLTVALGPTGANRNGALSDLLETTAENFGGQGEQFHQTIQDFSKFSQTLDNNKEELFGSAARPRGLHQHARRERPDRAPVQPVDGRRGDHARGGARRAEGVAEEPRGGDGRGVDVRRGQPRRSSAATSRASTGWPKVLVKQRGALDEILSNAPLALNNLYLTYNPQAGTLDTRSNQGEVAGQLENDPAAFLCGIVSQADRSGDDLRRDRGGRACPARAAPARSARAAAYVDLAVDRFDPTLGGLVEVER